MGGRRAAPAEGRGPASTSQEVVGEGSGRSPILPQAGPRRPSLGRAVRARPDPVRCKRLADCARPGLVLEPVPAAPAACPPPSRRRSDVRPAGPPTPHVSPRPLGPVPYQLGGELGRPSGIQKSRHWEVLGEGGADLKGTTTSFHWGKEGD